jgi:hypothetical protein
MVVAGVAATTIDAKRLASEAAAKVAVSRGTAFDGSVREVIEGWRWRLVSPRAA